MRVPLITTDFLDRASFAFGATTVRVGQAIFGDRLDPNDYWPVSGR